MKRLSTQPGAGLCYYNARAVTAKPLLVPRRLSVLRPQANTRCGARRRTHKPSSTRGGRRVPPQPHRNGSSPSAICRRYAESPSKAPLRLYGLFLCAPAEAHTGRCVPGPARHSPGGERPDSIDREKQRGLFMGIKNTAPCHFPEEGLKAQGVRPSSNR